MKLSELFVNIHIKIMADKRIISGVIATVIAIVSVGGYLGYQELAKR